MSELTFNDYLFDLCFSDEKGLILFNGAHKNKKYTKRDCFHYMGCDTEEYAEMLQLTATFQLCRKTKFTIDFYKEHIKFAEDSRILTDLPNQCGLENYDGFLDHRHDQSILSILQKKHNVKIIEDISQLPGAIFCSINSFKQGCLLIKFTTANRIVDALEILKNDTASTNVQMANF